MWEFRLLHILINISIVCLLQVSLSGRCVVVLHCGWTCIPLMPDQVEQATRFLAFWIWSFVKCLFESLAHVSTVLDLFVCSGYDSLLIACMTSASSPRQLVLYSFIGMLWWKEVPRCNIVQLIDFFIIWVHFMSCLRNHCLLWGY